MTFNVLKSYRCQHRNSFNLDLKGAYTLATACVTGNEYSLSFVVSVMCVLPQLKNNYPLLIVHCHAWLTAELLLNELHLSVVLTTNGCFSSSFPSIIVTSTVLESSAMLEWLPVIINNNKLYKQDLLHELTSIHYYAHHVARIQIWTAKTEYMYIPELILPQSYKLLLQCFMTCLL